jgi:hypothetical protein
LAAAYAEAGGFTKPSKRARKRVPLVRRANNQGLVQKQDSMPEGFRKHSPVRESYRAIILIPARIESQEKAVPPLAIFVIPE